MGNSKREVGGYRGRRTLTDILRLIATILAIAVILVVAGLFFGQRYIVYTDDGLELDIPFFQREEKPEQNPGSMSILEVPEGTLDQSQELAELEEESQDIRMRAVELSVEDVLNGTAAQKLREHQADTLILEMKAQSGKLNWMSEEKLAQMAKANLADDGVNEALRRWNAGDVYTVARVCCFRDDSLPYYCNRVALRTKEGNWRDEAGMRHLDPTDAEAQAYIVGLCVELAQLGFDEILLEHCGYPVRGNLDRILPPDGDFNSDVQGPIHLLAQVGRAVKEYGTVVSVGTETGIFTGETGGSGLNARALQSYVDRIWLNGADFAFDPVQLQEWAGDRDAVDWIVVVTDGIWQSADCHQAFLKEN